LGFRKKQPLFGGPFQLSKKGILTLFVGIQFKGVPLKISGVTFLLSTRNQGPRLAYYLISLKLGPLEPYEFYWANKGDFGKILARKFSPFPQHRVYLRVVFKQPHPFTYFGPRALGGRVYPDKGGFGNQTPIWRAHKPFFKYPFKISPFLSPGLWKNISLRKGGFEHLSNLFYDISRRFWRVFPRPRFFSGKQ